MTCPDYIPDDKRMGRTRPYCRYYQDGGTCSRPVYFRCICIERVAKQLGGRIVRQEVKEG